MPIYSIFLVQIIKPTGVKCHIKLQTEHLEFSVLRIIIIVGVTSLFKEDQYLETNHRNAVKQCGNMTYLILIPMYWLSFS